MRADEVYIDTSALAKWYVNEPHSCEFRDYVLKLDHAAISRLTVVELRCLLKRYGRAGAITAKFERKAYATFEQDIIRGHLIVEPIIDQHMISAGELIDRLAAEPLRTLDALHLAIALAIKSTVVATADRVMARAAEALGLNVVAFGLDES